MSSVGASTFAGANHQSVRQSNRAVVFRAIHALGPIPRIDLARQTGLNPGTVTNIVDELLVSGLASELPPVEPRIDRPGRVGRRPVYLQVNPTARYAIGIDLARSVITGAVINLAGQPIEKIVEPTGTLRGDVAIGQVSRIIDRLLGTLSADQRSVVVGVGIGAPGALSVQTGRFIAPPSYSAWEGLDLGKEIAQRTGVPAWVDNNANTAALAELWFGAGQGVANFVLLTLGTGVGAGLVLDGDLYRGEHDLAGEIGHVSIAMDGPRCACGNYGCLEMFVSVPRVLAAVRAAIATGEPSVLRDQLAGGIDGLRDPERGVGQEGPSGISVAALVDAARQGDSLAMRIMADVARYLAAGIVTIINTFDPNFVLIGRDLALAGDMLLDPVREEVRRRVLPALRRTVRIEAATFPDAPVVGAGILALRQFFAAPLASRAQLVAAVR